MTEQDRKRARLLDEMADRYRGAEHAQVAGDIVNSRAYRAEAAGMAWGFLVGSGGDPCDVGLLVRDAYAWLRSRAS